LEPSPLLPWIYGLIIAAAVCFVSGVVARFIRHKDGTTWYRGTIAFLAFAIALLLLAIYSEHLTLR
jgi:drug/metabolite transporter (DMT)-like permease